MERRSKEGLQAKYDYIAEYKKENYSMFSAQLKKEEYQALKELLERKKLSNAEFVRYAYECLLSEKI